MPSFGFVGPTFQGQNISPDGEDVLNLYPEAIGGTPAIAATKFNYYNVPGLVLFGSVPAPGRCIWAGNNRMFAVGAGGLYEINSGGGTSLVGTMTGTTGPAQIVSNGNQLLVWDGSLAPSAFNTYCATGTALVPVISSVGIGYIDGYFVALRPGGADFAGDNVSVNTADQTQINLSALLDGTSWDPLQYAIKGGGPDALQMIFTPGSTGGGGPEELWMFGKRTTEVWYNTGGQVTANFTTFPFERVPGAFIQQGLWAANSVTLCGNSIMFLGGDDRGPGVVWKMNGYIPQRVSTFAVENAIQGYARAGLDTSDAIAYSYQDRGHQFYVLNFPTAGKTWVYDITVNMWHRRASGSTGASMQLGQFHCWAATTGGGGPEHFLLDYASGNIYKARTTYFDDAGAAKLYQRTAPHLNADHKWMKHKNFELLYGGPFDVTRTFNLEVSDDGGFNFNAPVSITVGTGALEPGRAQWRRCGRSRDRVYRLSTTDALQQCWVDGLVDVEAGTGG